MTPCGRASAVSAIVALAEAVDMSWTISVDRSVVPQFRHEKLVTLFVANSPVLRLEVGTELAALSKSRWMVPVGAVWHRDGGVKMGSYNVPDMSGRYRVFLCSIDDFDVLPIAKHFGGDGERTAAEFECAALPWKR